MAGSDGLGGLKLENTAKLKEHMEFISGSPQTSPECRDRMLEYAKKAVVPYEVVREALLHKAYGGSISIVDLLAGSSFVLDKPKPREKSEELKARLQKLQDALDRKAYNAMVSDVTKKSDYEPEVFSSYKEQLGFGLHVAVTMFTGFAFGYCIFWSLFRDNSALHAAGGVLGLVFGMLLETFLFIIRDIQRSKHEEKREKITVVKSERLKSSALPNKSNNSAATVTTELTSGKSSGPVRRRGRTTA